MDDPIGALLDSPSEALAWLCLMCYATGYAAGRDETPLALADPRVRAFIDAVEAVWQARIATQHARNRIRLRGFEG